jgi:hypothetical protein
MIKVLIRTVGQRTSLSGEVIEMPAVPRVDDEIEIDNSTLYVRTVLWAPQEPDFDVYLITGRQRPRS